MTSLPSLGWPDGHADSHTGHLHPEALPLSWSPDTVEAMIALCQAAYPGEGCGFLLGEERDGLRVLQRVLPIDNRADGPDQLRRFRIDPRDFMKAEREAARSGLSVLGVFHSHPDHRAVPSRHDLQFALPTLSYPILALDGSGSGAPRLSEIRSWQLNDHRLFAEESIQS